MRRIRVRKREAHRSGDRGRLLLGDESIVRGPAGTQGGIPAGFQGLAQALAHATGSGGLDASSVQQVCRVLGARLACAGDDLPGALARLCETTEAVLGREPTYGEMAALAGAWGESTLTFAHSMSCEDPLTGLATLAHLRSRLAEIYRIRRTGSHALMAIDLPRDPHPDLPEDPALGQALRLARTATLSRSVFAGTETIAHAGGSRILVLVDRDDRLPRRMALLRMLLDGEIRVWTEGLPESEAYAGALLDELART
jgi:hypothetical protein